MTPRPSIPFLLVVILLGGLSPMWAVGTVGGEVVGFTGVDAPPALRFMPFAKQLLDHAQRAPERGVAYLEAKWGFRIEPEDLTLLADLYGDVDTRVSQRATREIEAAMGAPDARARVLSIGLEASREQSFELGRAFGRWLASLREREYDCDDLLRQVMDRAGSASLLGRWVVPREVLEHAESFEGAVAAAWGRHLPAPRIPGGEPRTSVTVKGPEFPAVLWVPPYTESAFAAPMWVSGATAMTREGRLDSALLGLHPPAGPSRRSLLLERGGCEESCDFCIPFPDQGHRSSQSLAGLSAVAEAIVHGTVVDTDHGFQRRIPSTVLRVEAKQVVGSIEGFGPGSVVFLEYQPARLTVDGTTYCTDSPSTRGVPPPDIGDEVVAFLFAPYRTEVGLWMLAGAAEYLLLRESGESEDRVFVSLVGGGGPPPGIMDLQPSEILARAREARTTPNP